MKESEILKLANMTGRRKRTANPRRHALACAICRHPDRAAKVATANRRSELLVGIC